MPAGRNKNNFYAVTYGREIGIYSCWTQAGDAVLGFAKAKYKGFSTYTEAALAMSSAGHSDFNVFDGEFTYTKTEYEQSRGHQLITSNNGQDEKDSAEGNTPETNDPVVLSKSKSDIKGTTARVYIDGSCIRNGASTAQAGYGLYWGDQHPWNCSNPLPVESAARNNKAELAAAIKAIQVAEEHNLDNLTIYSDSNYVVQGVTEWIYKWRENGWKTAGGEDVKNRDIWKQLAGLVNDSRVKLTWKHVAAHAGIPGNEEADKLAVKGAQQVTIKVTKSEELPRMSSMEINSATEEKSTVTITRPCVIVEQKESTPTTINSTIQHENKINITPKRKAAKDGTETPVPGSLNGSFVSTKKTSADPQRENVGEKSAASIEKEETVTIMTNMETILQNIVTEIHQLKEEQHEFRKEVKQQIGNIQEKQNVFEKSVLSFSSDVSENVRLCISKIEKLGDNSKREQADNHCHNELKVSIQNLQRKVESRLDVTKSSFQSLEASVSSAKTCVDQLSQDCTTEFNKLESKNNQINDKLLEMNKDFKATERKLTEVEKSLTTLSEKEEFMKPTRTAKERSSAVDNSASTNNKYAELQDDSDDEVIFKGSEPGKSNYESTRAAEKSLEKDTLEKSANTSKNIYISENVLNADESEKPKTYTRGNMVYLVGDSIAGQVNQVMLGKATKTFVKKLRAPKIDDLQPLTDQVKDAKLIIIHTGINNLRGKESATDKVNDIIKCVTSFKEVAPECEVVISKAIPIGDHKVDIERNLFNAEAEKKLTEIHKSKISFLDHGNLAERGVPIEDYYRKDLVHLVGKGVAIFTGNLEKEILRVLNKEEEQDKTQLYESAHSSQQDSGRNANDRDVHRGDRTFGHYIHTPTSDRQYNNRQKYTNERGQRYDRDNAVRGHFYGRGQRNDRDNGNRYTTYSRNHESSGYYQGAAIGIMRDTIIDNTIEMTTDAAIEVIVETMTDNIPETTMMMKDMVRESIDM